MKVRFIGKMQRNHTIKFIKLLRSIYRPENLGLQDAKYIADQLINAGIAEAELRLPSPEQRSELKQMYGVTVTALSGGLRVRLKQIIKAAVRDGETELAYDLLGVYNKFYPIPKS